MKANPRQSHPAEILKRWAGLQPSPIDQVSWLPAQRMINAADRQGKGLRDKLHMLLKVSGSLLSPLDDPLKIDFGLHRRLAEDREEGYSDRLHWIIAQLESSVAVFGLL